jgi:hypothetical protein
MRRWWVFALTIGLFALPAIACGAGTPTTSSNGAGLAAQATSKPNVAPTATTAVAPATPQKLTGQGTQAPSITLNAGLTLVDLQYSGTANFIVQLLDKDAKLIEGLANEIGSYSGKRAIRIPAAGTYTLNVQSSGSWTIVALQPGPAEFSQGVVPPQKFTGRGDQYSPYLNAKTGALRIASHHTGQTNFIVFLLDSQGRLIEGIANEIGPYDGTKVIRIPRDGVYLLSIQADGDWTVEATP